MYPKVSGLSR